MELRTFATAEFPLHPSAARLLFTCPWRVASMHLLAPTDEGGVAGDTGSAMHKAAAAFHTGSDTAGSLKVMQDNLARYPNADLVDAADLFLKYAQDPRNKKAELVLVERQVSFQIAAAPEDPTGQAISVVGTVDQVRREQGRLKAWDIKTSKKEPLTILNETTFQLALYCVGASIALNEQVEPGGVICPRRYNKDLANSPVFWFFPWKFSDIERMLLPLRRQVANIRQGILHHLPQDDCKWCHHRTPDLCFPKLGELPVLTK